MECSRCQADNPEAARFCGECGSSLIGEEVCRGCGHSNPAGQKFCNGCGGQLQASGSRVQRSGRPSEPRTLHPEPRAKHVAEKVLASRAALEGERKQVTVLFADVKGSMELAEQMDPEEWSQIMQRFFRILSEGVERFGGFVDKFTGDGIMALFGAPIAHEDHAQRACYAALYLGDALHAYAEELRRTQGVNLSTRLGLNSGEVVVGKIGDDLRMEYTAQGHSVGLAQRMEQLAAADSTYLTEHTARLVEGYFQLRDLGEFSLKGVTAPLRVYELQGLGAIRTRLDSSRARGFSKFVGREREMASLENALESALAGNGQVVGVVADAGTGKSRLCLEFVERCRARGVRVNEGHCPAHGRTVPYLPLLEMLRNVFGIDSHDNDHQARRKIAGELLLLDERFQGLLPILFEFMGVGDPGKPAPTMSPEGRQQRLYTFVRDLLQARSQQEPAVLFLDDLHWIDPGSDAFLAHAIDTAEQTRTLWLVNFRPEYRAAWMSKSYYQQLPLRPLRPEAIAALLEDLLGTDPSVTNLIARIHERTGGNPFFIEEIVKSLVENGSLVGVAGAYRLERPLESLEIPSTVHSVLAARLDRLGEREKRLLQTASVIGKDFTGPLLRGVVAASDGMLPDADLDDAISALARAEFIYEQALYPEVLYAFRHPLTHEVAYGSLLAPRRSQLHAAAARTIEGLDADKLDERAALLAYHWEQASEFLTAAQWHARAAENAGLDSPGEALRHWEKVWELSSTTPSGTEAQALRVRAASDLILLGFRQGLPSERIDAIFTEAKSLAVERRDVRQQVRLLHAIGGNLMLRGEPRRSIPLLEEAVTLADATGEIELRWVAREPLEMALILLGELSEALRINDEEVALSEADPSIGTSMIGFGTANTFNHRSWIFAELGRFEEAVAVHQHAEELARRFQQGEVLSWSYHGRSFVYERMGASRAALTAGRRAVESADKVGSLFAQVLAQTSYGEALTMTGEWTAACESLEFGLETARTNRVALYLEAPMLASLAEAHLGLGESEHARRTADEAIATALRMEMPVWEIRAQLSRARVCLALNGAAASKEVVAALDRAHALVQSTGARSWELQVRIERARLAELVGDDADRIGQLRKAHELCRELGATGYGERVVRQLEELAS